LDLERLREAELHEFERLLARLHELEAKAASGTVEPGPEPLAISRARTAVTVQPA
jgi:hypothetical protein